MSSTRVREIIHQFLESLEKIIPELKDSCDILLKKADENLAATVKEIVILLGENDEKIAERDESVLSSNILPGININRYWSELSSVSKDAIWKFLNIVLFAGRKYIEKHYKHISESAASTENTRETDGSTSSKTDDEIAAEIARRLQDPALREKMMETLHKTMTDIPEGSGEEFLGGDGMKAVESLAEGIRGTQIGKIVEEIANDLSGELNPAALNLPADMDVKSMNPSDLMGLFSNPDLMNKMMKVVGKIGENINKRVESGEIDKDALAREGQDIMMKSQDLLKHLNPQAAGLLSSLQGGR